MYLLLCATCSAHLIFLDLTASSTTQSLHTTVIVLSIWLQTNALLLGKDSHTGKTHILHTFSCLLNIHQKELLVQIMQFLKMHINVYTYISCTRSFLRVNSYQHYGRAEHCAENQH
jgi:hypothetical protein